MSIWEQTGIYHLEIAQRDFLGVVDEPMAFSEETIAKVIDEISANCADGCSRLFLDALARTLRGTDEHFRLRLSGNARRKFVPTDEHTANRLRRAHIAATVKWRESSGDPKEAAVAFACQKFNLSRAMVFKLLKEEAEWRKTVEDFLYANSLMTKKSH